MRARLIIETGGGYPDDGAERPSYELLPDRPATLGRSRDNTIVLRDEHASRLHAKIYFADGIWFVRDFGLNGTRVNGERVQQQAELEHGQEIRIGDTRMRFTLDDPSSGLTPQPRPTGHGDRTHPTPVEALTLTTTRLQVDELTALCQFMAAAAEESSAPALVRKALHVLMAQTNAGVVGFLNVDPGDPLAKLVIPESASVDVQLSRQLTRRVQGNGKAVWLGADVADTKTSESLLQLNDALCVPLKSAAGTFAALHVYKIDSYFAERDVRFAEALAGYLASQLNVLRVRRTLEAENSRLRGRLPGADDLVGDSLPMQELRRQIAKAAPQHFTVLVHGESGSGKELVALALHKQSQRADGPLVVVNCAAIAPSLLEAELFGYRKGAFSGADRDYPGLFQQADEGTLFLDEVGELSLDCQAKLLRVIEGKSFRPVGTTTELKTDVRVIAATHRNLEEEVKAGRFRQDLYFRLRVIQIEVPPLRAHAEDVPYLVQYFLDRLAVECRRQVKLTDAAMRKLMAYNWPGNVRQLRAVLESAVVMCEGDTIDARDIVIGSGAVAVTSGDNDEEELPLNIEELQAWAMDRALKQTSNNVTQAAKLMGVSRDTLNNWMKRRNAPRAEA
jgi:two-component system response regulator HydG